MHFILNVELFVVHLLKDLRAGLALTVLTLAGVTGPVNLWAGSSSIVQTSAPQCRAILTTNSQTRRLQVAKSEVPLRIGPSQVLNDPIIMKAIDYELNPDFKAIVDMVPRRLSEAQNQKLEQEAERVERLYGNIAKIKFLLAHKYENKRELLPASPELTRPRFTLNSHSPHRTTFDYIEKTWFDLIRVTPRDSGSTLIPLPHPIAIAGDRFQEGYYWDTLFGAYGLFETGRFDIAKGLIDNFAFQIKHYGFIPNGNREYYTRSQPPVFSRLVRAYVSYLQKSNSWTPEAHQWLKQDILPSIIKDYQEFWMNPKTRFDSKTKLNHHWDELNTPRPERYSSDPETTLGRSFRDVRAEAESGKDFTDVFEGETSQYAGVLLNSVLYGVETDIAWLLRFTGNATRAVQFDQASTIRRISMQRYMQDPETGLFYDYHLTQNRRSPYLTADTFFAVALGVVKAQDQQSTLRLALQKLERAGGVMASEVHSGKQWDAPYVWAPHMYMAVEALSKAGMKEAAFRLTKNYVTMIDRVFARTGTILEKYDAIRGDSPIETGKKYETQKGFLWTNGIYVYLVRHYMNEKFFPIRIE